MTTIIPELTEAQLADLPSQAEAKVYRALRDGLPRDFVVFFQVGWILRREEEQAKDGETDFVVCHPDLGYVCIEVKGGGVGFDASSGDLEVTPTPRLSLTPPLSPYPRSTRFPQSTWTEYLDAGHTTARPACPSRR